MGSKSRFCRDMLCMALWFTTAADAEEVLFDADQWGEINLKLRQSVDRSIESVLAGNPDFEPLATYRPETRLRRLSRPVGRLEIRFPSGKFITCTATLISANLLLTNHHCVPGTGEYGPVVDVVLLMGYYSATDTQGTKSYVVDVEPSESSKALDYAVLNVEGNPGSEWGWATLRAQDPQPGDSLLIVHHPGGKVKHITRGGCQAGPTDKSELFHKCDTLPGSSGAPIISDDSEAIVALHYAGEPSPGPGSYNYGKLVSWISAKDPIIATAISRPPRDDESTAGTEDCDGSWRERPLSCSLE